MITPSEVRGDPVVEDARGLAERQRLGVVCARSFGVVHTLSVIIILVLPDPVGSLRFAPALIGLIALLAGFLLLPTRTGLVWTVLVYLIGLGTLAAFLVPREVPDTPAMTLGAVTALASSAIPSLLLVIGDRRSLPVIAVVGAVPVTVLAGLATVQFGRVGFVALAIGGGWLAVACAAVWLARSARQAERGAERLRAGYAVERRSTEAEAELRYGARMMHDTVLATLTLIAHSGQGVDPETLRAQARADGALLEQLRTRGSVAARRREAPASTLPPVPSALTAPWRVVHERCSAHGLVITWHGSGELDAPPATLDALVGAVSECLENVIRHSGELRAEVTLSQDARAVRAVVTDTGVGFLRDSVPAGRLGLAESVEARIRSVGGSARIFSSPGRGTTVLLEVPR